MKKYLVMVLFITGCQSVIDNIDEHDKVIESKRKAYLVNKFVYPKVVEIGACTETKSGYDVVRGECIVKLDNGEIVRVRSPTMVGMTIKLLNSNNSSNNSF